MNQRLERLSERELDILTRIAHGATNREIAEDLYLAESTVRGHVEHIFLKLGVRNRVEASMQYWDIEDQSDNLPP